MRPSGGAGNLAENAPISSVLPSIAGGILILVCGLPATDIWIEKSFTVPRDAEPFVRAFNFVLSSIVLVSAIWLVWTPQWHKDWGVMIIVFSVATSIVVGGVFIVSLVDYLFDIGVYSDASFVQIGGGFTIGLILSLIGGIQALRWDPRRKGPRAPPSWAASDRPPPLPPTQ